MKKGLSVDKGGLFVCAPERNTIRVFGMHVILGSAHSGERNTVFGIVQGVGKLWRNRHKLRGFPTCILDFLSSSNNEYRFALYIQQP